MLFRSTVGVVEEAELVVAPEEPTVEVVEEAELVVAPEEPTVDVVEEAELVVAPEEPTVEVVEEAELVVAPEEPTVEVVEETELVVAPEEPTVEVVEEAELVVAPEEPTVEVVEEAELVVAPEEPAVEEAELVVSPEEPFVTETLTIKKSLESQDCLEGTDVTFTLITSRSLEETESITWFKNNIEISTSSSQKYDVSSDDVTHTFTIREVTMDDDAEYTVRVGDVTSSAFLQVEGTQSESWR